MPLEQPKLAGKSFVFAGFNPGYHGLDGPLELVKVEGGEVLSEATSTLSYLVLGPQDAEEMRTKAERLIQRGAPTQLLDVGQFCGLFLSTQDDALAWLTGGEEGRQRWQRLCGCWGSGFWIRPGIDLCGVKLRGAALPRLDFRVARLDGADLREADLSASLLMRLEGVRLEGANLSGAVVHEAQNCKLQGADLSGAKLAKVTGCNLDGARLVKAALSNQFAGCSLRKADLSDTSGCGVEVVGSDLTGACLRKADWWNCQGAGAVFWQADLTGALIGHATLAQADFTQADLSQSVLVGSDLTGVKLVKAKLAGANLTETRLNGADLSYADLSGANLAGADLTNARIDGANLSGANLTGAILDGLDLRKAKGTDSILRFNPQAGPRARELDTAAGQAELFFFRTTIALPHPLEVFITVNRSSPKPVSCSVRWDAYREQHRTHSKVSEALVAVAREYATASLRLGTMEIEQKKCSVKGQALRNLAIAAWCEVWNEPVPTPKVLREQKEELRASLVAELRSGPDGINRWNARVWHERGEVSYRGVDLSGAQLQGVLLQPLDFEEANFAEADLTGATLDYGCFARANFENATLDQATLQSASFRGANCKGASLRQIRGWGIHFQGADLSGGSLVAAYLGDCKFTGARLTGADLSGANLTKADLRGVDLSTANLNETDFTDAQFDEHTRFPATFQPPQEMQWAGAGPCPGTEAASTTPQEVGTFAEFLERLKGQVDPARLSKALAMLKAERFQLFSQVDADSLVGVVRSQGDPNLVYSCRLGSDGNFSCCTQNLRPCGGLRGAVCKHLLVLLVGLTRAEQADPATVLSWVNASRALRPILDGERMSATFVRYQSAQSGEIDWRPTETIPEDYYAL